MAASIPDPELLEALKHFAENLEDRHFQALNSGIGLGSIKHIEKVEAAVELPQPNKASESEVKEESGSEAYSAPATQGGSEQKALSSPLKPIGSPGLQQGLWKRLPRLLARWVVVLAADLLAAAASMSLVFLCLQHFEQGAASEFLNKGPADWFKPIEKLFAVPAELLAAGLLGSYLLYLVCFRILVGNTLGGVLLSLLKLKKT